ncbi:helix-turn-helix domain-containing protein [Streptomyces sp. NPDC093249]|uniref:helix-turn-helix domain-containing protein n=1 Tax=unclassified Streptomyces TaxID=2593676 RepID=UPI00344FA746
MNSQNLSAQAPAPSRNGAKNHPSGVTSRGVVHENTPHTTHFTVVGNHLAQHGELSLMAIGLATHIQSLPAGSAVDIRSLADRFPEGTARIAGALRELETHGYLRRGRERTAGGRVVTRTVSCNQPDRTEAGRAARPRPEPPPRRPEPPPRRTGNQNRSEIPRRRPQNRPDAPARRAETGQEKRARRPEGQAQPPRTRPPGNAPHRSDQRERPRRKALPAVPAPAYATPDLLHTAVGVLSGLRLGDPRLLISAAEAEHLAPGVVAWLERELPPEAVHQALTSGLPTEPLYRPAALLAHRLTARLPPLPPFRPPKERPPPLYPLHNCDTCDRAYRGPEPGKCTPCRTEETHGQLTT